MFTSAGPGDGVIQYPQPQQGQEDVPAVLVEEGPDPVGHAAGQQVLRHMAAVQGRDGDQVEDDEGGVDADQVQEDIIEGVVEEKPVVPPDQKDEQGGEKDHLQQVHEYPGQGDDDVVPLVVFEVPGIHRHGLGPAEAQKQQAQGAQDVEMIERVQAHAAQVPGRGVAAAIGRVGMAPLVEGQAQQQGGQQIEELQGVVDKIADSAHGAIIAHADPLWQAPAVSRPGGGNRRRYASAGPGGSGRPRPPPGTRPRCRPPPRPG